MNDNDHSLHPATAADLPCEPAAESLGRHRASISKTDWRILKALAQRTGRAPAQVLSDLIKKAAKGTRGRGAKGEMLGEMDRLAGGLILNQIHYDQVISSYVESCKTCAAKIMSVNEYADLELGVTIAGEVLAANRKLLDNVSELRKSIAELGGRAKR